MARSEARWPDCATGWHDRCTQPDRCGCPCHTRKDEDTDAALIVAADLDAARTAATTSQIRGMIGRWYPQAAAADGGALLAECLVDGPLAPLIAEARRYRALRDAMEGLAGEFRPMPRLVGSYAAERVRAVLADTDADR